MLAVISADMHGFIVLFISSYRTVLQFGAHTSRESTVSIIRITILVPFTYLPCHLHYYANLPLQFGYHHMK